MSDRISDITTIILRTAGECEIEMDWIMDMRAQFRKLALKVERHLRLKKKSPIKKTTLAVGKKHSIIWRLCYFLEDDYPERETLPYPTMGCVIEIIRRKSGEWHRATLRDEVLGLGRGPMMCIHDQQGQLDTTFDHDKICAELVPQLIELVAELEAA